MSDKKNKTLSASSIVVGYVRTSTALQADKVSPELQKQDIQDYCQQKGYNLIGFYEDIQKYKAGSRMVEPSARRSDRPQWLKMIADAKNGRFEEIIGWRSDRLYRGVNKALLALSELITENNVAVELVKETFNISYAPVIAWATGLELEAKHDRLVMGMTGRFQRNKIWIANPPYGYDYIKENPEREARGEPSGELVINDEECFWVNQIWEWYANGVSYLDIHHRLIDAGVKQKGVTSRKYPWHKNVIQNILRNKYYSTGKFPINYDGERYEIDIPPIISPELAQRVEKRRKKYKVYPSGKTKNPNLLGGLVYCEACNIRMRIISQKVQTKRNGETTYLYYHCKNAANHVEAEGCARSIKVEKLDYQVWEKLWNLFTKPDEFKNAVEKAIAELNTSKSDASKDKDRIESRLIALEDERNWVIAQGRRKRWSDEELDRQLAPVEIELHELRNELKEISLVLDNKSDKISEMANLFAEQVRVGNAFLNDKPKNKEEEAMQFKAKKKLINAFIAGVYMKSDKTFVVYTNFDFSDTIDSLLPYNRLQKNGR
jgi:site-specific DNA recombinase